MGNTLVGQSGGPTAVINSSLAGVIRCVKDMQIGKVYGMHNGIEGFLKDDVIDIDDHITDLRDLSLLKRTPSAYLGSCRYKLPEAEGHEEVYKKIFDLLKKYDIDNFLYIGGNDSMDTVYKLSTYAYEHGRSERFIGIPKTIDNDLPVTDHCPGFGSAAKFVATSMKEIIRDNYSFGATEPKLCVVEIMGRNAGWLTAASALAKDEDGPGPDLIYLPEVPFDMDLFLSRIKDLTKRKRCVVVACSEGIHLEDGTLVCEMGDYYEHVDAFGHKMLSGAGRVLANAIGRETGYNVRNVELSILQRCAAHMASRVDVDEAYNVGYLAVQAADRGETGKMVTIQCVNREPYYVNYTLTDVRSVATIEKKVPREWITADDAYVTRDYIRYASPLLIGTILPYEARGVPKHMSL